MSDVVGNEAAAELVGVRLGTWSGYVSRGVAPQPYRREVRAGYARPVWRRRDIEAWIAQRPGSGSPGQPRPDRRKKAAA